VAITQDMTVSFKVACLSAEMDFSSGTSQVFKMALYTTLADLDYTTAAYTATNEVVNGGGYTTGGLILTVDQVPVADGRTGLISFADAIWTSTVITAAGGLIYATDAGLPSVAVIDFGGNKTTSGGNFEVNMPPASALTAILRFE
jgi:hypothetical protein